MDSELKILLQIVFENQSNVAITLAQRLNITRQAASSRLRTAIKKGFVQKEGIGRGVTYKLISQRTAAETYLPEGLSEDRVWRALLYPVVSDLPENVIDIWRYGFTEMVNNAIDHSGAEKIKIWVERNPLFTQVFVVDDGQGIFSKIQKALDLFDPREAILELAKGKFTTDPANHSGEGIFFSSKMFDRFDIYSGNLCFTHSSKEDDDWLIEQKKELTGTNVIMRLMHDCTLTTKQVFDKFALPEEYTFAKTIVPVKLAQYEGEKLVSRSQAKRLIFRIEKFKTVILDFADVEEIGQAFADEVFRVFQNAHKDTKLVPIKMNQAVKNMVNRAKAAE